MKIGVFELVSPMTYPSLSDEHKANIHTLLYRLNCIREASQIPMVIRKDGRDSAGYRTKEMHYGLYMKINSDRVGKGLKPVSIPSKSWHLFGGAADVLDMDGKLKQWILEHLDFCESLCLWFESFDFTPTWVHAQIYPPASMKRFFNPY